MADNKFKDGPGGRLVRAEADATRVAPYQKSAAPYIAQYDKINIVNPFDWKYFAVKGLKKANTMLGGDIERTGYDRESYSDLMSRLEQTPGTLQNTVKNVEAPMIPSPFAGPANLAFKAYNFVRPYVNKGSGAVGEVVLDPANFAGGKLIKGAAAGLKAASNIPTIAVRTAKAMKLAADAAPWTNRANDAKEVVGQYEDYEKKPRLYQEEPKELSEKQKKFLRKISGYNFGKVK